MSGRISLSGAVLLLEPAFASALLSRAAPGDEHSFGDPFSAAGRYMGWTLAALLVANMRPAPMKPQPANSRVAYNPRCASETRRRAIAMHSSRVSSGLHVIFGAGPVGIALAQELVQRRRSVRLVTRSGKGPPIGGVERSVADASDRKQAVSAAEGAEVVYHAVGADYGHWAELLPPIMSSLIDATASTGARLVYADNLYAYGPVDGPLTEDLPAAAAGPNGRLRAQLAETLLEAHRSGRLQATIGRSSDFFGPQVRLSIMGERVFGAVLQGKPAQVLGAPDQRHTYTFVADFARALAILGEQDGAVGEVWHVPSAPTVTTREFVEMIAQQLGRRVGVRVTPGWIIRALGLVNPTMRAVVEQLYQSERPFVVDHGKFARTFETETTPHREAIQRTVDWYRSAAQGR
jgi:nucleoside-diphosphate-sugar epimerase